MLALMASTTVTVSAQEINVTYNTGHTGTANRTATISRTRGITKYFAAHSDDWNDPNNWQPVGVPTINDDVALDGAAHINSGEIGYAKSIVLNTYPPYI